jgi:GAF domain-containing protein
VVSDTRMVDNDPLVAELARLGEYRAYAEMPLRSGHVTLGYLTVYHDEPRFYRKTELDLLEILANQVTAALDNAQLLRALELYAFEMTQLVHLSRISAASLDVAKLVASIPETVRHMMSASHVTIALYNNGGGQIQLVETTGSTEPPIAWSQVPEIQPAALQSLPRRQTFQQYGAQSSVPLTSFMTQQELGALILVPIVANQALLGVIMLGRQELHIYSEREWQLIETAANQIAAQISNAQTYSATHAALNRRLDQLSVIEDIVRQISGMVDLNHIISVVLEAAMHTTRANMAALAMLTDADEFWIIFHRYVDGKLEKHYLSRPKDQGVIGEVTRTGSSVLVPDNRDVSFYVTSFLRYLVPRCVLVIARRPAHQRQFGSGRTLRRK